MVMETDPTLCRYPGYKINAGIGSDVKINITDNN